MDLPGTDRVAALNGLEGQFEDQEIAASLDRCDRPYETAEDIAIRALEQEFVDEHIETLQKYGQRR